MKIQMNSQKKCQLESEKYIKGIARKNRKKIIRFLAPIVVVLVAIAIFKLAKFINMCNPTIDSLSVGDTFYYGKYDGGLIEWTVLDIQDNKVFVIATDAIDKMPYNDENADVTWDSCSLRMWLNGSFLSRTFSREERSRIVTTTVTTDDKSTDDRLFLLSIDEVNQYFPSDQSRECEYDGDFCWWWLRSMGEESNFAACVNYDGSVSTTGFDVDFANYTVRPALWLDFES